MKIMDDIKRKQHLKTCINESKQTSSRIEVIVETSPGMQKQIAKEFGRFGKVEHVYDLIPCFSITIDPDRAEQLFNHLYSPTIAEPHLESFNSIISVDVVSEVEKIPHEHELRSNVFTSVEFESLWNLRNIGAYEARQISTGERVNIAIIDTGVEYTHPELKARFGSKKGYDFVDRNKNPFDEEGHGTHVAGISCSANYGVSQNSTIYAVRVLNEFGAGRESDVIAGVEWCVNNQIDVANMSLGARNASRAFERICEIAYQNGVLLVAAAGNEREGPSYPAAFDQTVIAVAAVDQHNRHADFSNIWKTNDISAPGVEILSTYLGGSYTTLSGTSMATPHVTGTVALALSLFKNDPRDLEHLLDDTAQHLDHDGSEDESWVFGSGLVRADSLLRKLITNARFRYAISKLRT
jgi:subtilisin family serine protease